MIGELIQEYLVGLGVRLDKPGFAQAESTINRLDHTVESATGNMARNFVRASAMIGTAVAGITASVFGLMKSAASQDLAMQKLSRQMMVGKDAAWAMKSATDALGESIQDIMLTPELMGRFEKLTADGRKMQVGGDFAETMKNFRDLTFEFTRLKQEVSYAMTWVGYYLMKYLNRPLSEACEKFRSFNDMFVKNMSVWTEKAARALVYIINVGRHFLTLIVDIGKALWAMWESFPRGVKIAAAALAGLTLVLKANPLTRMLLLVSSLLLLIDDYYGHMEGKQSAFGKYWDKLNEYIDAAKVKWEEFKKEALPFWEKFVDLCSTAKDRTLAFARSIVNLLERVGKSDGLWNFLDVLGELGKALGHITASILGGLLESLQMFYESADKHGALDGLGKSVELLWGMFVGLIHAVARVIDGIANLTDEVRKTEEYRDFIDAIAELVAVSFELFNVILDLINIAFRGLFGEMGKTDHVYTFRDAIRAVLSVFTGLIRAVSRAIKLFSELLSFMRDSTPFRQFWEELGKMIDAAIEKTGKFGRALLALKNGEFKKAWQIIRGEDSDRGGSPAGDGDRAWNRRVVYERLQKEGYSAEAIAGILGRLKQEHNFDTSDVPEHDVPGVGHVGGYGMYQWNGSRTTDFLAWAEGKGLDPQDPGVQTDYAIKEAYERNLGPERMNKMSVSEAATAWTDEWEVGKHGYEQSYAAEAYDDILSGRILDAKPHSTPANNSESVTTPETPPSSTEEAPQTESKGGIIDVVKDAVVASARLNPVVGALVDAAEVVGNILPTSATANYHVDPLLYNGLMAGMPPPTQQNGNTGSIVYQVNVGGVTVNGTNRSAVEIGKSVGREVMSSLERSGAHILRSRTMTGDPLLV
jgi:phage-related tail protein